VSDGWMSAWLLGVIGSWGEGAFQGIKSWNEVNDDSKLINSAYALCAGLHNVLR